MSMEGFTYVTHDLPTMEILHMEQISFILSVKISMFTVRPKAVITWIKRSEEIQKSD